MPCRRPPPRPVGLTGQIGQTTLSRASPRRLAMSLQVIGAWPAGRVRRLSRRRSSISLAAPVATTLAVGGARGDQRHAGAIHRVRRKVIPGQNGGKPSSGTSQRLIGQPPPFGPSVGVLPEALILLSVRDADDWWKSASNTIFVALATYFAPDAPDDGWTRMGRGMMTTFTPDWQDEELAKAAYLAHNEFVRATAPRDRLLEWAPRRGLGSDLLSSSPRGTRPAVSSHQHHGRNS